MRNLILTDFKPENNWPFVQVLRTRGHWDIRSCVSNTRFFHTRVGTLVRYLFYFLFPLRYVLNNRSYDVVLGWQQFYALNYAFWLRLFHCRSSVRIVVMTFIYKEKKGFCGQIYHKYIHYCLSCPNLSKLICHSRSEVDLYTRLFDLPDGLVQYVPLGIDSIGNLDDIAQGGYVFSTGRSNRDYDFLIRTLANTDFALKIACEQHFDVLPPNIEVYHNCYNEQMYTLLKGCFCVCIPLSDREVSSGQLVVLQAMQFGKPVLVTRSNGVVDYVHNGQNGFLIENDSEALLDCLQKLITDRALYNRMSSVAQQSFFEKHRLECMAQAVLDLL